MTQHGSFRSAVGLFIKAAFLLLIAAIDGLAESPPTQPHEDATIAFLKGLSIEDLLQTEITSASKKAEPLFDTASAVFVITEEDLRRTGARNIPEALRMVPGLQVAQINANTWGISARGFTDWFSNKLLVMIDGRSVYTPLFSGVYWDVQDTVLADIERIEVIRGPGATVWGANAVNGVINIITKKAAKTQGGLVSVGAGTHDRPTVAARYGTRLSDTADLRVYAKGFQRESFETASDQSNHDAWENLSGGFRADWQPTKNDEVSFDGRIYEGESDISLDLSGFVTPPYLRQVLDTQTYSGGHLLSSWSHRWSANSKLKLQAYYDRTRRDQVVAEESRDTVDLELQHNWNPGGRQEVVWGLGFRWTRDHIDGTWNTSFDPGSRIDRLWSAFVQDDIMLVDEHLWLTLGSKFEHNDYSGFEVQPSARLRIKPLDGHMIWAAVSRAVRTPSRSDHDIRVNLATVEEPPGSVTVIRLQGNENFESEELIAYEAGYRWQPDRKFYLDLTAFYNDYDRLRAMVNGAPVVETTPLPPHLVVPQVITNQMEGHTIGFEALATWSPVDYWRLSASYAWIDLDLRYSGGRVGTPAEEGNSPEHQVQVRSYLDLPWNLQLDAELYYVDRLESPGIDAYTRVDMRLEWNPSPQWAFSVGVENLTDETHAEFNDRNVINAAVVPRTVYGQIVLNF